MAAGVLSRIPAGIISRRGRQPYDMETLLTKKRSLEITARGMSVYDSALHLVAAPPGARLCWQPSAGADFRCLGCQIDAADDIPDGGRWFDCVPGVRIFIAP